MVSGSVSSPYRGSSHLSLALLCSLSVAREYLALRDGPRGFTPDSTCPVLLRIGLGRFTCHLRDYHPLWSDFPDCSVRLHGPRCRPTTPRGNSPWFRLIRFRSPLLTESRLLSLPPGNEMFQFPGLARESRDQYSFDSSPGLIAVFHALYSLLAPRHPPHALSSLAAFIPSSACHHPEARNRPNYSLPLIGVTGRSKRSLSLVF